MFLYISSIRFGGVFTSILSMACYHPPYQSGNWASGPPKPNTRGILEPLCPNSRVTSGKKKLCHWHITVGTFIYYGPIFFLLFLYWLDDCSMTLKFSKIPQISGMLSLFRSDFSFLRCRYAHIGIEPIKQSSSQQKKKKNKKI